MIDEENKKVQELKELEEETYGLRIDAAGIEKKIPGRIVRIKELEGETEKAKGKLTELYANLRVLNNQIDGKNSEIKAIMQIYTGNFYQDLK